MGKLSVIVAALVAAVGCADDAVEGDDDDPVAARTFEVTIANTAPTFSLVHTGTFATPVGASAPGPIGPGEAYEITFTAGRAQRLSFATMFSESNDYFYAPSPQGIALYDDAGAPRTADVTDELHLWDAGTEADEEPGIGRDQAPRQSRADAGERDPDVRVRHAEDRFHNLPEVAKVIRVTLAAVDTQRFVLRIENVSTDATLATSDGETHPVPLSPGVWAVHEAPGPLFAAGTADRGEGLEAIAEDGAPGALATALAPRAGVTTLLARGVWVVHRTEAPLFDVDARDRAHGLEQLAEDGEPAPLADVLAEADLVDAGTFGETAVGPGGSFTVRFRASPGDRLSFATMFAESNDLFFAPPPPGIALFTDAGVPWLGVRDEVELWDAGTEQNQEPGVGNAQAPRQLAPDEGIDETAGILPVWLRGDGFHYPDERAVIRVTVTAPEG